MSNENTQVAKVENKQLTTKGLLTSEGVKKKFEDLLGKKAQGFITSVLQIATNNELLAKADPMSIYNAAAIAATLDLPINQNLGFAYIIPYKNKGVDVAQFQMGYKGFIQLAQRSGQFQTISSTPIYKGQLVEENPLTGFRFDFSKKDSEEVIGYAAYFKLLNGFEKTLYMSKAQVSNHGTKYSQTFKKGFGLWKDDFDAMAQKTVIKLLLSKFAPLSIQTIQQAIITDQSVINDADTMDVTYVDNTAEAPIVKSQEEIELDRINEIIADFKDYQKLEDFEQVTFANNPEIDWSKTNLEAKKAELKKKK